MGAELTGAEIHPSSGKWNKYSRKGRTSSSWGWQGYRCRRSWQQRWYSSRLGATFGRRQSLSPWRQPRPRWHTVMELIGTDWPFERHFGAVGLSKQRNFSSGGPRIGKKRQGRLNYPLRWTLPRLWPARKDSYSNSFYKLSYWLWTSDFICLGATHGP